MKNENRRLSDGKVLFPFSWGGRLFYRDERLCTTPVFFFTVHRQHQEFAHQVARLPKTRGTLLPKITGTLTPEY